MTQQPALDKAVQFLQKGNPAEAEKLFLEVLKAEPINFTACHLLGIIQAQKGRYDDALKLMGAALSVQPNAAPVLLNYGIVLGSLGRFDEALASFSQALAIKGDYAEALFHRANALASLGRFAEALGDYDRAVVLRPDFTDAWNNRGNALRDSGRSDEALASFAKALAIDPRNIGALLNRGSTLMVAGRTEEALADFTAALAVHPDNPDALTNRGMALQALQRRKEALASFARALAIHPRHVEAMVAQGGVLQQMGEAERAASSYTKALALAPAHAPALNNLGSVLRTLGRVDASLAAYDRAVAAAPDYAEALYNRGNLILHEYDEFEKARRDYERAAAIAPELDYLSGELLHLRMKTADWNGFDAQSAFLRDGVRAGQRVVSPFVYQAISEIPADLQAASLIYAADRHPPALPVRRGPRPPRTKIRLGYVSGEFRPQATAYLMAGLYEHHDKSRFELVAIDAGRPEESSPMRRRLEAAFDKFVSVVELSDTAAAERVAAENIDILINLNGYFGFQRMGIFAHRAAPLQVNYLGFPATLGASYMDYILADATVIPENEKQFYTEQVVWLPDSYQANDSKRGIADATPGRAELGLPEQGFVFCNFNQSYKFTPAMFAVWMDILARVPGSVLWLLEGPAEFSQNLRRHAAEHGIAGERLIFAPTIPLIEHLARMKQADLSLDTLPYNAHTTASDALWAGVPLVTCRGTTFPGRVAASLLQAIGLPELVTENWDDYTALALRLAQNPDQLAVLRRKLATNRLTTPLFDTDRFRRHIEAGFSTMWEMYQKGESPRSFAVSPLS